MSLSNLPPDLLLMIAEQLKGASDINSLERSNYRFHQLLNPLLYTLDQKFGDFPAVLAGFRNNNAAPLRYALTHPQISGYEFTLLSYVQWAFVIAAASNPVAVVEVSNSSSNLGNKCG
jgi:hypothetical protein